MEQDASGCCESGGFTSTNQGGQLDLVVCLLFSMKSDCFELDCATKCNALKVEHIY
jgi:hypothetical protein